MLVDLLPEPFLPQIPTALFKAEDAKAGQTGYRQKTHTKVISEAEQCLLTPPHLLRLGLDI